MSYRPYASVPRHKMKILCLLLAGGLHNGYASAAESAFELGEVHVVGNGSSDAAQGEDQVSSVITRADMAKYGRDNAGDALNLLSGVTIANVGQRNEKVVSIRGQDYRQTPVFLDGVLVSVPYDGYADLNRFTTADLAEIQVAKGFSSIVYGPNTLAGAINLVTRKPKSALEGDVRLGVGDGNSRTASVNIGSRHDMWWFQAGSSYASSSYFPLSSDFRPTATENGGHRNNSYYTDKKNSFKVGLTPNATDEYIVSYYKQEGEKGDPPQSGASTNRYWQWPYWNVEGVSLTTKTALGKTETLKVRLYQDKLDNSLAGYTNGTYSQLKTSGSGSLSPDGISVYNDKTTGGSVELESTRFSSQTLRFVAQYKTDEHAGHGAHTPVTERFKDTLTYYGAEDNIQLSDALLLSVGLSTSELKPEEVYKSDGNWALPGKKSKTGGQVGLFYDYSATARFYATVAEKSRLPALKDRYSAKFGTVVPNPGLKPEDALNYEVGYQGAPWQNAKAEAALFYSDIKDKIQTVYAAGTTQCGATVATQCQILNVGEVHITGLELALSSPATRWFDLGGNYTWMRVENVSDATRITDIPTSKLFLNATAHLGFQTDVVTWLEAAGKRWASNTVRLSGYSTLNAKIAYRPLSALTLETGITNLTDRNYSLADGYPNPGRMWFANARYSF